MNEEERIKAVAELCAACEEEQSCPLAYRKGCFQELKSSTFRWSRSGVSQKQEAIAS